MNYLFAPKKTQPKPRFVVGLPESDGGAFGKKQRELEAGRIESVTSSLHAPEPQYGSTSEVELKEQHITPASMLLEDAADTAES
eukprot:CAMPEP_0119291668 /NCGR_PEP_ID=MMETSP1329-20130426/42817_1 /TAXON_ID=114041 /ORGANISM="Genus nov. species nov., Strain RCC1024" /LENGTH=83 /DNA_ID=CAMNT_0007292493 /DNA_START=290 /DNA_END=537 /DNA_ORIENTATION=-